MLRLIPSVRTILNAGAAFGALAAMPALAQEAPAASAEEAAPVAEGEIVVTARRREESLIDVPISMSVVSGDSLVKSGAADITALQDKTPNLTLQIARGSNSTLIAFSRGVGQQDPLWGFEPGVALYIDDVYVARPQGAVLDIFDVERVEVLRGPQGTLYGRNTIGGAVKYVTRRLGHDYKASARVSYGSYNQVDLVGQVVVPVGDTLSLGAAVAQYWRDGFGTNLTTGAEHYNKDVFAARLSAEFTPSDTIFIRVAGDRVLDRSNPRHGTRLLPNGTDPIYAPTGDVYDTRAGIGDRNRVETRGLSVTGEVNLSDALTFKTITSWRDGSTDTVIDFDNTILPTLDVPAEYSDRQFTQELQLLYEGDRIQGVFGVYYLNGRASGAFDTVLGALNTTTLTAGEVFTKSYAAFGDFSFDVTDQFKISAGLRYTRDEKTGTVFRRNYTGIRSPRFGNAAAVPGLIRSDYTNSRDFEKLTPRVSLSYEPRQDLNFYASYGKGFKSGGFDMRGDAILTPTTVNGYKPETIDSYELGMKGAFLDRTLFVNIAGFYSNYKDQQVTIQVPALPSGIASFVDNAGKGEIYGFEFEARVVPSRNLSASLVLGYTHADYKEFFTFIGGGTTPVDVSDQRAFQNTPEWTANASVTWSEDLAGGTIAFTPSVSLRSDTQMFELATPALDQDGYALVDASLNWTSAGGRYRIGVAARNLTDARYRVGGYNFPGALFGNSIIGYYGPPRTFTGTFEVKF
ncbi:TonB-dependent receptor [Sphingomonas koreensis]|uniref:TonB-dependent receptor n=1 Tax=Sphingomonas koreensis TaxID=93064 RepID=UPI000836F210|nr:TonB-dependent receptor [Sphingomonas koreensis]PJI88755.1 iron complex outermembrane receptor protein [Sphingomonas koreensis]RSU63635.1 TonB-dependent receptor [Sphingomonas koreensis]RSU69275.1 TonB-dependent receptor [Sphingomonas koreensis]